MNLRSLNSADNVLILGHHNADPDAICSMIAFKEIYQNLHPDAVINMACDDISKLSTHVLDIFAPDETILSEISGQYDLVVLLDTNSLSQLGSLVENLALNPENTLIIDHHEESEEAANIASTRWIQSDISSTCEMMVTLYVDSEVSISPRVANLLLTGILFDTRRFFYAGVTTFDSTCKLIDAGAKYKKCVQSLIVRPERSERIARLKAASRLTVYTIDEWIIVTSKIGAYEASACRGIIDLGADVAIVGGRPSQNKVRISSRSTSHFSRSTGINLGLDVMAPLGELIGGQGGGHQNAAGANGVKNRSEALKQAVELIRQKLQEGTSENQTVP
ncbi:MAG: hypothetical protein BAJATHORv1_100043 [Candidatus Thorarchaeota archaeon]|nr:MAG: hypothetical protein BAJATHORv1_100043 [Candidatus Thorarchaeota archaeon]